MARPFTQVLGITALLAALAAAGTAGVRAGEPDEPGSSVTATALPEVTPAPASNRFT